MCSAARLTLITVRPMEIEHIDAVRRLLVEGGWHGAALPSSVTLANAQKHGAAFVAFVAEESEPVGFVRALSDGETVSYVAEIVVSPEFRDSGIGRALLEACRREYPNARIDLLSSEMAQGFYEHIGFDSKQGYRKWP